MPEIDETTCEVKIDGAWQRLPVIDAHRHYRDALKRCPACHGQVRTVSHHLRRHRAILLHVQAHDGCPLAPRDYKGVAYPHPEAIG